MMESPAQVDVIILSWNRTGDTIAAIRSAAGQVGVAKRILIVDQGSEPDALKKLEAFLQQVPCASLKKLTRNVGVADGRNIASSMGSSPCIVALDSDAEFANEHALARAVAHMGADPRLCAIGFRIVNYFNGVNDGTSWDYPNGTSPDECFATSRFIGAGHAIRRSVFESVGGYDKHLFFCGEEVDLCYRMLNTGHRIVYMPDVVIRHKVSSEHRVFWGKGRYYYTVRNTLYTNYKFGASPLRLAVSATAFFVKGCCNGIALEALRAFKDCLRMCKQFYATAQDHQHYHLSGETWAYILQCEPARRDTFFRKIQRQLTALPHQG
jgi:GT2 family glycosyltransferase